MRFNPGGGGAAMMDNILGRIGRKVLSVIRRRMIISNPRRAVCTVFISAVSAAQPVDSSDILARRLSTSLSPPVYLKENV